MCMQPCQSPRYCSTTESLPWSPPGLYCCDRAEAPNCQTACRHLLRTMNTDQEIMEGLIKECGTQPLPQDPMWQCFLSRAHPPSPPEEETPHPAKMDCAKLHCCSKANTSVCRWGAMETRTPCFLLAGCNRLCALLWQGKVPPDQHPLGQPDMARLWSAVWVQPNGDGAHQLPGRCQRAMPAGLQGPDLLHQLQQQVIHLPTAKLTKPYTADALPWHHTLHTSILHRKISLFFWISLIVSVLAVLFVLVNIYVYKK